MTKGGKRVGAGRKPAIENATPIHVRLGQEDVDMILSAGGGNASLGIRVLLKQLRENSGRVSSITAPSGAGHVTAPGAVMHRTAGLIPVRGAAAVRASGCAAHGVVQCMQCRVLR